MPREFARIADRQIARLGIDLPFTSVAAGLTLWLHPRDGPGDFLVGAAVFFVFGVGLIAGAYRTMLDEANVANLPADAELVERREVLLKHLASWLPWAAITIATVVVLGAVEAGIAFGAALSAPLGLWSVNRMERRRRQAAVYVAANQPALWRRKQDPPYRWLRPFAYCDADAAATSA